MYVTTPPTRPPYLMTWLIIVLLTSPVVAANELPDIDLQGNGLSIPNADTTPSPADGTDFGAVSLGTSVTHTFTIQNRGKGQLNLTSPVGFSKKCQTFAITQQPSSSTLNANESTYFQVAFIPPAVNKKYNCTLKVSSDDQKKASYLVSLKGLGVPPLVSLNLLKEGTGHVSSEDGQIDCGDICTAAYSSGEKVTLTATPEEDFVFNGWDGGCNGKAPQTEVTLSSDTQCTAKFIQGTPDIDVSPMSINFDNAALGTQVKRSVIISNYGNASLQLGQIFLAGNEVFVLEDQCSQQKIAPWGGQCFMVVKFVSSSAEVQTATLSIPSNDPDTSLVTVDLQGASCQGQREGEEVSIAPTLFDFGELNVGDSKALAQSISITNSGCGALQIGQAQVLGAEAEEFNLREDECYYGRWHDMAFSYCEFTMAFSPTSAGAKDAYQFFTFNDPDVTVSVPIQATATSSESGGEAVPVPMVPIENREEGKVISVPSKVPMKFIEQ